MKTIIKNFLLGNMLCLAALILLNQYRLFIDERNDFLDEYAFIGIFTLFAGVVLSTKDQKLKKMTLSLYIILCVWIVTVCFLLEGTMHYRIVGVLFIPLWGIINIWSSIKYMKMSAIEKCKTSYIFRGLLLFIMSAFFYTLLK